MVFTKNMFVLLATIILIQASVQSVPLIPDDIKEMADNGNLTTTREPLQETAIPSNLTNPSFYPTDKAELEKTQHPLRLDEDLVGLKASVSENNTAKLENTMLGADVSLQTERDYVSHELDIGSKKSCTPSPQPYVNLTQAQPSTQGGNESDSNNLYSVLACLGLFSLVALVFPIMVWVVIYTRCRKVSNANACGLHHSKNGQGHADEGSLID